MMRVELGLDAAERKQGRSVPVAWDTSRLINGHMLLVGKSGTGKTHTLRSIVSQLERQAGGKLRVHVIDSHGDIEIPGASSVKFSESTRWGFNPLEIDPDPDFGGIRKRIQFVVSAINRTSRQLGTKQEPVLRAIITDIYSANGFYEDRPETWTAEGLTRRGQQKRNPTLEDAARFARHKLKAIFAGTDSRSVQALDALSKKVQAKDAKERRLGKSADDEEIAKLQDEIAKLGEEAIDLFSTHVREMRNGREFDDLMRYDSRDVLKSVLERLENLQATGIFKSEPPPFDSSAAVWRYDIRALSSDERKLFVQFALERIFRDSVKRGLQQGGLREIIVLDEAHHYLSDDPENIVNVIAKEARKFGVGLFCASQSPTHFSDDFISNVGTKVVLGLDEMFWEGAQRKMRLDRKALEWIVPRRSLIAQMSNAGEARSSFSWVLLPRQ